MTPPAIRRRSRRRHSPEATDEREAKAAADWQRLKDHAAEFSEQSPLKSEAAKDALAETLAGLIAHQRILIKRDLEGTITAEESRTLPAIASNIKRVADALALTQINEEDEIGEF